MTGNRPANGKKVLVLGGTGAMGVYVVPELASLGYEVAVVSLDQVQSDHPRVSHTTADAKQIGVLEKLLSDRYDAIVDFMIYSTEQFRARHELLLRSTEHYIYLSSYRVYGGGPVPITEDTPRLLDASSDAEFLATDDYALSKARGEDILRSSGCGNWTIVRPAITYSQRRFQLVTLEAPVVVARARQGLPVVLPQEALAVQATMSWAGDVAKLMARLVLNPAAYGEPFTLATAEHRPWGEIAEYYRELIGLQVVPATTEDYLAILGSSKGAWYQLAYDRLFERIVDNSKVLRVTGLQQADFMPLRRGLEQELSALPQDVVWPDAGAVWQRMDDYVSGRAR